MAELPVEYDPNYQPLRITVTPRDEGLSLPVSVGNTNELINASAPVTGSVLDNLLGLNGQERFQTWPERMTRSGLALPADVYEGREAITDPDTGRTSGKVIERAMDTAGTAGLGGIGMAPKGVLGTSGSNAFYSNLERTIANAKVEKATPEQWQSYLKNQPGIKSEELEFAGLNSLPNKVLSKAELESHVAENGVKLGEVWKGKNDGEYLTPESAHWDPNNISARTSDTKYSSYQLPGSSGNYRELLLTVPEGKAAGKSFEDWLGEKYPKFSKEKYSELPPDLKAGVEAAHYGTYKYELEKSKNNYKSSHWDEPNVLAHIRMNDRDIPGVGKTLHVEEIQSDWHQAGRKSGYKGTDADTKTPSGWGDTSNNSGSVPNAPFKKSWDELALKRVLTEAVNNNYDAVSWTPGEAQAARYDLSKQVKAIRANPNPDGTYQLGIHPLDNQHMRRPLPEHMSIPPEKLPDIVGKELAEKIVKGEGGEADQYGRVYRGLDLKVGGEGMKAFYDKMLPAKANSILKKMGGKVEHVDRPLKVMQAGPEDWRVIGLDNKGVDFRFKNKEMAQSWANDNGMKLPVIKITPQMREKIAKEGFPLFTAPQYVPVDHNPFEDKQPKLVPIEGNPFQ